MKLGYCSNGLAHHEIRGGLELVTSVGYRSISITVDHGWLNAGSSDLSSQLEFSKDFLRRNKIANVIEATGPYTVDSLIKHGPSLADPATDNVAQRIEYIQHCIELASELGSIGVSLKSGFKPSGLSFSNALDVLVENLRPVVQLADEKDVRLAIEPTPGMLIDSTGRFDRLLHVSKFDDLKLTLDVGQLFCLSEVPVADVLERWRERLINVHLCDVRVGRAEHLAFGEGQIYLPPIFETLQKIDYVFGVHVELDRHSHDAVNVCKQSYSSIQPIYEEVINDAGYKE